jgi:tetratricopeptide (TPR) repeat protein
VITPGGRELWVDLNEVVARDHGDERTAALEEVVWRADDADAPRLTFLARRELAAAHQTDGRWDLVYPLLEQCLQEHEQRPWRFERDDEAELLEWYAWLVEAMVDFPERTLAEVHARAADLERRFRQRDLRLGDVYRAHHGIAVHVGDLGWAEEAFARQVAASEPEDPWLDVHRIDHLLALGDEERALELAEPFLREPGVSDELTTRVRHLVLLPLTGAGRWEEAALTFRRLTRGMSGEYSRLEDHGVMAHFCALTGNLSEGTIWLGPVDELQHRKRPLATMEYAACAALLTRQLGWSDTERSLRALAQDLAARFDERNGTTACGERIRRRLRAEQLVDFLPLYPTSRPPIPAPPPDLTDAELLDRAELHDLRCEPDEARVCLARVSEDLPEPLRAQRDELTAKFFQSPETGAVLRRVARTYEQHGDHRRAELTRCWIGLWVVHEGDVDGGVTAVQDAVERLYEAGEGQAWGEYWLAYVLAGQNRHEQALHAITRGKRHAHDALVMGTLLALEAQLTGQPPVEAYETFVRNDVPEKALEALYLLPEDITRTAPEHPRVVGHLRYLRALRTINAGMPELAVDDLNEAVGQAQRRNNATVEQWFHLTHANYAARRYEDAVDAGLKAVAWLDHLKAEDASWEQAADETRFLVAQCYQLLGDQPAAVREYRVLAAGDGPMAAAAFVAATALLEA